MSGGDAFLEEEGVGDDGAGNASNLDSLGFPPLLPVGFFDFRVFGQAEALEDFVNRPLVQLRQGRYYFMFRKGCLDKFFLLFAEFRDVERSTFPFKGLQIFPQCFDLSFHRGWFVFFHR